MQSFFLQTANDVIIISLDATDRVISWVITGYTTTVKTGVENLKKYLNKKMSHGAI